MKVFGIGLNKTGTRSVAQATRILGLRTMHDGSEQTARLVLGAAEAGEPLLHRLDAKFDAFFDVHPLVERYEMLDRQYPGSKFVLTTRDRSAWVESRRRHVEANRRRAANGSYSGSFLAIDVEAWVDVWERHHEAVRRFFADRPDQLLELDVTAGGGFDTLAPFLGQPVPHQPFPRENIRGRGTYSSEAWRDETRRRVQAMLGRLRRR